MFLQFIYTLPIWQSGVNILGLMPRAAATDASQTAKFDTQDGSPGSTAAKQKIKDKLTITQRSSPSPFYAKCPPMSNNTPTGDRW
jgi:hypothetical protein